LSDPLGELKHSPIHRCQKGGEEEREQKVGEGKGGENRREEKFGGTDVKTRG